MYFPRNQRITPLGSKVVSVFERVAEEINSSKNDHLIGKQYKGATSDTVLARIRPGLESIGFRVEAGKRRNEKISVPVLFGRGGRPEQSFEADAWHEVERFVLEVEAGRAVLNYQFLKDLFEACVMVDVDYLCIALRNVYQGTRDFEVASRFLETLYASGRLHLPLKGLLLIGY